MSFPFDCPRCGKHYELTAKHVGRRVKCAQCNTQTRYYPAAISAPALPPPRTASQSARVRPPDRRETPRQPRGPIPSPLTLRAFFWLTTICVLASTLGYFVIAFSLYKVYSGERDLDRMSAERYKEERNARQDYPHLEPDENWADFDRRREVFERRDRERAREQAEVKRKYEDTRRKAEEKMDTYAAVTALAVIFNLLAQLAAIPFILACIYKMWAVIQDGRARTSPGAAAFCMLIPFYNLYWIFVAVHGWTGDANKYIARYKLDVEPVSPGLSLLTCLAMLTRGIPGCGLLLEVFIVGIGLHWLFVATSTAADIAEERLAKEPVSEIGR